MVLSGGGEEELRGIWVRWRRDSFCLALYPRPSGSRLDQTQAGQ